MQLALALMHAALMHAALMQALLQHYPSNSPPDYFSMTTAMRMKFHFTSTAMTFIFIIVFLLTGRQFVRRIFSGGTLCQRRG